ncbi:ABC-2 transporter permease [Anaerocolumna sp. MB42-C2]|uniref:ABC-2 transporter permease n=1 Tax=Anaerocolumna sp. MB42-C2 TaxID=3070997 RepID=UPI0027DFFE8B|nr:ABC-2 transporter permease [Anaerocolumna sp. MB42-C2]WMJ85716.1 ABC-2 transporter permease [Anaerocolumna sp. MB42-C2]
MAGLFIKDLYNIRKYVKQIGLTVILFAFFAINLKSPSYLVGMIVMMSSMLVITTMSYDDIAKWDKYALTMPIVRKDIVLSKYIFLFFTVVTGTVISGIAAMIMSVVMKIQNPMDNLLSSGFIALIAIFMFSILLPILFKYGVEKARIMMFAVFAIPFLAVVGLVKLLERFNIPKPGMEQLKMFGFAFPVIVLIAVFISYNLSVKIYSKKEL